MLKKSMKSLWVFWLISAFLVFNVPTGAFSACTVCHSKNPKMVKMHEALGFKDCFTCHGPGSKRVPGTQKEQMQDDPLCMNCHR